jgi:hypothetical protein
MSRRALRASPNPWDSAAIIGNDMGVVGHRNGAKFVTFVIGLKTTCKQEKRKNQETVHITPD